MKELGMELSRLRQQHELSRRLVAEFVDCSDRHIQYIEEGKKMPSFKIMKKLAETYKCSLDHLAKFI